MPVLSGFHHVALSIKNLDISIEWYSRVLGMEELFREAGDTRRSCVMGFPDGSFGIALVQFEPGAANDFDPNVIGLDHVGLTVNTRAELEDWGRHFDAQGVDHSGVIDIPIGAILNFKDPDGIALALFWDDPALGS